jgi:outer membrane protein assembly factor BamA
LYFRSVFHSIERKILIRSRIYFRLMLVLLFGLAMGFQACRPARNVQDGDYLLNKVTIKTQKAKVDKDELMAIVKQKPNRRILGILRFHLGVYNLSTYGKTRKWKKWMGNTVGEEPIIMDTLQTIRARNQLKLFMQKKGYFDATVQHEVNITGKKKANLTYRIEPGTPYLYRKVSYKFGDNDIRNTVWADTVSSLIKSGRIYDEASLLAEQQRLAKYMRNNGYYRFQKEHIFFEVDTTIAGNFFDLYINFTDAAFQSGALPDTVKPMPHKVYFIDRVLIYPNFSVFKRDENYKDTLEIGSNNFIVFNNYYQYRNHVFTRNIFFKTGDFFSQQQTENTYRRLSSLRCFKAVNIDFRPSASDTTSNKIDAFVKLTPAKRQSYSLSAEGTHSSGNFGLSGNVIYQNRNIFQGAEIFEIRLRGAMEVQQLAVDVETDESGFNPLRTFNTIEFGPEFSLQIPGTLTRYLNTKFRNIAAPRSSILSSINYQRRPDYQRLMLNAALSYSWRSHKFVQHIFNPIDINYIFVKLEPGFEEAINRINDVLIRQSYRPLLIPSFLRYTFIYSDQNLKKNRWRFFRVNFQSSGNVATWYNQLTNQELSRNNPNIEEDPSTSYRLFGIRYSQFILGEVDYRYYFNLGEFQSIASRINLGVGKAYGNSQVLPFVKSFFGGGANDLRAWQARTLGPGSFPTGNSANFEQIGDVKLQANLEYRFKIYKYLNMATFLDAGNIWLLNPDSLTLRPGGQFSFDRFYKEIALGTGIGFRVDFSFSIIRLDVGIPLYDPGYAIGERWVITQSGRRPARINLGIGYPF